MHSAEERNERLESIEGESERRRRRLRWRRPRKQARAEEGLPIAVLLGHGEIIEPTVRVVHGWALKTMVMMRR